MYKGIEKGFGDQIGSILVTLPDNPVRDGHALKKVETRVEGESSTMVFPVYNRIDFIDTFGLPPYNEWAMGVDGFRDAERSFQDTESGLEERYQCKVKLDDLVEIRLNRQLEDEKEIYEAEEMILPYYNASVGRFRVKHSEGEMNMLIERDAARGRENIRDLEENLSPTQQRYMKKVRREESLPDIAVNKNIELKGVMPAVQQELYPFWDRKRFDQQLDIIELGYLGYGENSTSFDQQNGRWYKLFHFENFDYPKLEIREGNWESQALDPGSEERRYMSNYEKYLYQYTENV